MDPLGKFAQKISDDGEAEVINEVKISTAMKLSEQNLRLRNNPLSKDTHWKKWERLAEYAQPILI